LEGLAGVAGQALDGVAGAAGGALDLVQGAAPAALGPAFGLARLLGSDLVALLHLEPEPLGLLRLAAFWFLFLAKPSVAYNLLDFYVLGPLEAALGPRLRQDKYALLEKLGGGNFGQVYKGLRRAGAEETVQVGQELDPGQKRRRVVLKRIRSDGREERSDFLASGSLASGSAEVGQVEQYMNSKLRRGGLTGSCIARYTGTFIGESFEGGFSKGERWLVWDFESDATLGTALCGDLGEFPECVEDIVLSPLSLGRGGAKVVQTLMRKILTALNGLHNEGIVHRDIKPDNLLITNSREVKLIDLGAATDLSTGINFSPDAGLADPLYMPPEEYVLPVKTPPPPTPLLAVLGAPLLWFTQAPNKFDTYSTGIMFLEMAVPELRTRAARTALSQDLQDFKHDLKRWRRESRLAQSCDFSLLDRGLGSGWDLACRLVCPRKKRLTAAQALMHPYFALGG